jgi:hypothetical protein
MTSSKLKVLAAKVTSQHKTFKRGLSNQTVDEVVSALLLSANQADNIAKLKKSDNKWLNLVVKLGENAVEMDSKIAELEKANRGLKVHIKNGMAIQEAHERISTEDSEYEGSYVYSLVERFLTESPEFSLEAHNLEQQAKGMQDWVESDKVLQKCTKPSTYQKGVHHTLLHCDTRASELRNQAKALKEGK